MDEDSDSGTWVLVNEIDCAKEALTLNPPDSDQESDGSISIISDHPTDSYSEEEHEQPITKEDLEKVTVPIITIENAQISMQNEDMDVQVPAVESTDVLEEENHVEDVSEGVSQYLNSSQQISDGDVSSTSESSSSKNWAFVDDKSKLELDVSRKPFYLDCSKEPILEISSNDTEHETENSTCNHDCQTVVRKERESGRDGTFNRIGFGLLISMMVLIGSHLIQQYSEYQDDKIQSPTESFLESLADNEKARAVIDFCMDRQKLKGEYSEHAVEKCVIKRIRKKNREEAMKKTEIYLQMKERILEIREEELVKKEKEMLRRWQQHSYSSEKGEAGQDKENYKKNRKRWGFKEKKRQENNPTSFHKGNSWDMEETTDERHKKHPTENVFRNKKKFKKSGKDLEETLANIKEKVKKTYQQKDNSKQNLKEFKGDRKDDPNEEWYIKYNPIKNTIELINITTLSEQDSLLIRNGNKTINGQWYFSLYGTSRANIRHKEKAADWYFKRGHFRENRRDHAKWYFDYMSSRDNTRYLYSKS